VPPILSKTLRFFLHRLREKRHYDTITQRLLSFFTCYARHSVV